MFYISEHNGDKATLKLLASYAYQRRKGLSNRFHVGEGLVGQCALEKERIVVTDVPPHYVRIGSGLGNSRPRNIAVIPILFEGEVKAVVELASFNPYTEIHLNFLDQLAEGIGIVLNSISAAMRTEELLKQSQSLAQELQSQQSELQEKNTRLEKQTATLKQSEELLRQQQEQLQVTDDELGEKARMLALQKHEVETKNRQIETARTALQEKAEQLSLTSKYKSEFLANMSHELRTPLNSMLLLGKLMSDNAEGNLQPKQLEYMRTIQSAGGDLLTLINGILDMAKIESGKVVVEPAEVALQDVRAEMERQFLPAAQQKGLAFEARLAPGLPKNVITDGERLRQVLKNLLSNACKFTHAGRVELTIAPAVVGWSQGHPVLGKADAVIAFQIKDTGIGIAPEMLKIIFEPFHQVEGGAARKYGGTGLGLSISREIARLLGAKSPCRASRARAARSRSICRRSSSSRRASNRVSIRYSLLRPRCRRPRPIFRHRPSPSPRPYPRRSQRRRPPSPSPTTAARSSRAIGRYSSSKTIAPSRALCSTSRIKERSRGSSRSRAATGWRWRPNTTPR